MVLGSLCWSWEENSLSAGRNGGMSGICGFSGQGWVEPMGMWEWDDPAAVLWGCSDVKGMTLLLALCFPQDFSYNIS